MRKEGHGGRTGCIAGTAYCFCCGYEGILVLSLLKKLPQAWDKVFVVGCDRYLFASSVVFLGYCMREFAACDQKITYVCFLHSRNRRILLFSMSEFSNRHHQDGYIRFSQPCAFWHLYPIMYIPSVYVPLVLSTKFLTHRVFSSVLVGCAGLSVRARASIFVHTPHESAFGICVGCMQAYNSLPA